MVMWRLGRMMTGKLLVLKLRSLINLELCEKREIIQLSRIRQDRDRILALSSSEVLNDLEN